MTTTRKTADTREKELRLAIFRIERGRSHTKAEKLSISAVAREAGVSSALLHNHYPAIANEIRTKLSASSRQKRVEKQSMLNVERERTKVLRKELAELKVRIAQLASINEMLAIENIVLAAKYESPRIATLRRAARRSDT
jgi:AcrR family transcriptional regulator